MICAQCKFYNSREEWCRKHLLNTGRYNWCEDNERRNVWKI